MNDGKWVGLFNSPRLTAKGMKLGFVSPVIQDGVPVVQLRKPEIEKLNGKWESAVVMYVVGDTLTITAVTKFLYKDWKHL